MKDNKTIENNLFANIDDDDMENCKTNFSLDND